MNSSNEASGEKCKAKGWEGIHVILCKNGCRSRNLSNYNATNPQRRPQNLSLQNSEKAWTFNRSWTYEIWQMSTHSGMKDGTVSNLVFTDEKKFDVQQCLNRQNHRVFSRDGSVEGRRVSRRQNPLSVMVWAAITATGRSPLVFIFLGVKLRVQNNFGHFESWTAFLGT